MRCVKTGRVPCRYQVQQDHPMVAAMRATGAILLGKTNMHELGVSPLGLNMHYGIPRNPHNPSCFAGGSSSGSAAVVAAGLCPFAIGKNMTTFIAQYVHVGILLMARALHSCASGHHKIAISLHSPVVGYGVTYVHVAGL